MPNPLISDRDVDFLLYEVLDAPALCALPHFAEHSRDTFDLFLDAARKLAREQLFPEYRVMDEQPPTLRPDGSVAVHPALRQLYPRMVELGILNATRPEAVGGQQLPVTVAACASAYLMAANLSAFGYLGLTAGAARLIEAFGTDEQRREYMTRMYSGEWTGTMSLTEPQAGSSLTDVQTRATPTEAGHYLVRGSKIFISAGDQDISENIVHMTLARIDGAPPGIKGVSLLLVPKLRREGGVLVPNDLSVAGVIHKVGWRGIPSIALNYGENGECHGWLVGQPHRGISYMFQMMNEARLMVGLNGVATATVAYHAAREYAATRTQGRELGKKDPTSPQIPIIGHADVRRMLLRQKAIAEGGLGLLVLVSRFADLAEHALGDEERQRAFRLLDLLTPVAKSFPAEKGFEANALAVQVHGGYGYSSEYLPEAWLRDQKLNSIHEGTTGMQSLDLLGRKVVMQGGRPLVDLAEELEAAVARAVRAGLDEHWARTPSRALARVGEVTARLGALGASGDIEGMLLHSADFLELFSTAVVGWVWLFEAAAAQEGLARHDDSRPFYEGKLRAARYWFATELPRVELLAQLCESGEPSYAEMRTEWF